MPAGECGDCGKPLAEGENLCELHKEMAKEEVRLAKECGTCYRCGVELERPEFICDECADELCREGYEEIQD